MKPPKHITTTSPSFIAFLTGQALGAANDNAIKATIIAFVLDYVIESEKIFYSGMITALLPIAFLTFSPFAGYLADRYPKNRVLFFSKSPEILAMFIACFALYYKSLPILLISFFLMSMQSAFFGPVKYGILPEAFKKEDLTMANGVVNMTTNIAILLGAVLGSVLYKVFQYQLVWAGVVYMGIALLGTAVMYFAPKTRPGNKSAPFQWNVISCLWIDFRDALKMRPMLNAVWGISFFYALGALFMAIIPIYGNDVLGLEPADATMMLAVLTIGIAVGSLLAGFLSRGFIEMGVVPIGCFGLAIFALDMATFGHTGSRTYLNFTTRSVIDLLMLGVSSGFFIVPLNAQLQSESPENEKGRFIAFMNIMSFTGILISALLIVFLSDILHLAPADIIFAVGMVTLTVALLISINIPDLIMRFFIANILRTIYRVRIINPQNRPNKSIITSNHLSWIDPFIIGICCEKMLCYMMYRSFYDMQPTKWIFKKLHSIPVSGGDSPEKKQESLDIARNFIEKEKMSLCIFPEGKLSRVGNLLPFKNGFERIANGVDCTIVPVYLDGLWGSVLTYENQKYFFRKPYKFSESINVIFGDPMPATTTAFEAKQKVSELSADAYLHRLDKPLPIHIQLLKAAKNNQNAFISEKAKTYSFLEILNEAISLDLQIFSGQRVVVLLPSGKDSVVANLGLLYSGAIPVNLDINEKTNAYIESLEANDILTNKEISKKLKKEELFNKYNIVLAEDISQKESLASRTYQDILNEQNIDCDSEVTIYFNDNDKAVSISHRNIYSNVKNFFRTQEFHNDIFLSSVSFATPFSFVANFWLPSLYQQEIVFIENSATPQSIKEVFSKYKPTVIITEKSWAKNFITVLDKQNLNIKYFGIVDEEFCAELKQQYLDKYDIKAMWLFAIAECGPFVAINRENFIDEVNYNTQITEREGTLGLPLPEVAVKIMDMELNKELPENEVGILLVKGANVTSKYLNEEENEKNFRENWFVSGKKAKIDDKGFIVLCK